MSSNGKLWLYSCSRPLGFPGSLTACVTGVYVCVYIGCRYTGVFVCLAETPRSASPLPYLWNPFNITEMFFLNTLDLEHISMKKLSHCPLLLNYRRLPMAKWFTAQTPLLVWLLGTSLSLLICSLNHFSIIIFFLSLWTAGTTSPHPPTPLCKNWIARR